MAPLAQQLGSWAAALGADDIPAAACAAAKRCIVDVVGVTIAGAQTPVAVKARHIAVGQYPSGVCTVIGSKRRLSTLGAAYCNAIAAHCLDFDDTCFDGIAHGSAVVWPAVLAAGETAGVSGKAALAAFVAGSEVEYTLGRFFTDHLYMKGWWNTAVLGVIGAAVAAARVQGFDETLMTRTIENAACFAFGPRVLLGTELKPVAMGSVASNGIYAARLAKAGLCGPPEAFESPRGVIRLFNDGIKDDDSLKEFGSRYRLLDPGVAFKRYPVCSAAQAATEALDQIIAEHGLNSRDIMEIVCEVPPLVMVSLVYPDPQTVTQSQFSMPFALGCVLTYGNLGVEHIREGVLDDPHLQRQMRKVSMVETASFPASDYDPERHPEAARVKVTTTSGKTFARFNGAGTGMPAKPMPDSQLDGKFISCAERMISPEKSRALLDRLRRIESLDRISGFFTSDG